MGDSLSVDWANYFYYDETSPTCLRWKIDIYSGIGHGKLNVAVGDVAGSNGSDHYKVNLTVDGNRKTFKCHRIIYELLTGVRLQLNQQIDHINGNAKDNKISNLRVVSCKVNQKNRGMQKNNSSGVTGVSKHTTADGYTYYRTQWRDIEGKKKSKCFSVLKFGEEEAFRLAQDWRMNMIAELNKQGAGYTERHGTNG